VDTGTSTLGLPGFCDPPEIVIHPPPFHTATTSRVKLCKERDRVVGKAESLVAAVLALAKVQRSLITAEGLDSVCKPTFQVSIRSSQYNATAGLILVTRLPIVRSAMQKKRNVNTWLAA